MRAGESTVYIDFGDVIRALESQKKRPVLRQGCGECRFVIRNRIADGTAVMREGHLFPFAGRYDREKVAPVIGRRHAEIKFRKHFDFPFVLDRGRALFHEFPILSPKRSYHAVELRFFRYFFINFSGRARGISKGKAFSVIGYGLRSHERLAEFRILRGD